jgi:hypothetical protein
MITKASPDDPMETLTDNNGRIASLEMREVAVGQSKAQKMTVLLKAHTRMLPLVSFYLNE